MVTGPEAKLDLAVGANPECRATAIGHSELDGERLASAKLGERDYLDVGENAVIELEGF